MTIRPIDTYEHDFLRKLLSATFSGRDQLAEQVNCASVHAIDDNGSLRFTVNSTTIAPVIQRIPVEAQCLDSDNVVIHALLHVVDGKISELEIYRDDSQPILRKVEANEWEVLAVE
jgi:hypothetical protein